MADVLEESNIKYWVTYIRRRIDKNKNFLGFISGPTGSGKSWSSLRIAEELDPEFNIERIVFTGLDLMKLINSDKVQKGNVIVFEEAGVALSNRNWQSTINKMLNYLLQTFRHRNFILILNSPYMDFIDAATRKLFHAELRTTAIDTKKKQVKLKPHLIQYNSRMQKFYYKRLRVITRDGVKPVDFWNVDKPSNKLIKEYEDKKKAYTTLLNKEIMQELQTAHEKKQNKRQGIKPVKKDIDIDRLHKLREQGLNYDEIGAVFGVSSRTIQRRISEVKSETKKSLNKALLEGMRGLSSHDSATVTQ